MAAPKPKKTDPLVSRAVREIAVAQIKQPRTWLYFLLSRAFVFGLVLSGFALGVYQVLRSAQPAPSPRAQQSETVLDLQVTADAQSMTLDFTAVLMGRLPKPAPNQISDPQKCRQPARWLEGGCWLAVADVQPPCDPPDGDVRNMWPHDGKCWMPMAIAGRAPSGGGSSPGPIADPP